MKPGLIFFLLLIFSITLCAQDNKGKFFVETGVKVFGDGDYQNFIGKSGFSFYRLKWETINNDGTLWQEGDYDNFSWAVAPRLGYKVSKRIKAGIDFQFYQCNLSYGINYNNLSSGLFLRLNFNDKKISPFFEMSSGFGLSKKEEEHTSPGGTDFTYDEKQKLFYYSGAAGLSFVLSGNVNLNLSAKFQNTSGEEIKDNNNWSVTYITEKYHYVEVGPMLLVSYIFKGKTKNQE